jgi:fructose-1,6-bisphosphatase/inositol monophosphatase family enzyme
MNNFSPLAKCIFDGLLNAFHNHKKLAENGKLKDKQNRFGEMALRADVEAEEIILSSLKKYTKDSKVKLIYRGEELGDGEVGTGEKTIFAVFDGLDGSDNYLNESKFEYGTMIAVSETENPKYKDFTVSGLAMMEERKIVITIRNKGMYLYDVETKKFSKIENFSDNEKFSDLSILANKYFPEELNAYGDTTWIMTGSTAWSIYSICTDIKYNGLIEVTRKGNLEQPILYLMITTLGGVMVDKNGNSIGNYDFKTWGQNEKLFLITAKSKNVAEVILKSTFK